MNVYLPPLTEFSVTRPSSADCAYLLTVVCPAGVRETVAKPTGSPVPSSTSRAFTVCPDCAKQTSPRNIRPIAKRYFRDFIILATNL